MNIYNINIWGPCPTEKEARARRPGPPDARALVFAPTMDIANQICYAVATRDARHHSNYQEIDSYSEPVPCVWVAVQETVWFWFEETVINDLLAEPILPKLRIADHQRQPGTLYLANCIDEAGTLRGQFWVYAADAMTANTILVEHVDIIGLFDHDSETMRVELESVMATCCCVFWNVDVARYDLHTEISGGRPAHRDDEESERG